MISWEDRSEKERENIVDLLKGLACLKCDHVLDDAIWLECEHRFCTKCLPGTECSVCGSKVDSDIFDHEVREYLRRLVEQPEFMTIPFNSYFAGLASFEETKRLLEEAENPENPYDISELEFNDDWIPRNDQIFRRDETMLSQKSVLSRRSNDSFVPETQVATPDKQRNALEDSFSSGEEVEISQEEFVFAKQMNRRPILDDTEEEDSQDKDAQEENYDTLLEDEIDF